MRSPLLLAALFPLAACTVHSGSSSSGDAAPADGGPTDDGQITLTCQNDPRVDTYVANLTKASASGALKVTLVASDPAPPAVGTNTWTVRVTDGGGTPIVGAALQVTPFMPDHGHGPSVRPSVTPNKDGTYTIGDLSLFMGGIWRVTIGLPATDAGAGESVPFFFCVAG